MTAAYDRTPPLPKTLPKAYKPLRVVASGGMGVVYEVLDQLRGQVLALKQLKAGVQPLLAEGQAEDRASIAREFRMLSMLRHPYILPALDFGFDGEGAPFFTMPLLKDPVTIVDFALHQPFSTQLNLLIQTLQALAYLHRHRIIHNDLKPSNILVVDGRVQILDFGLSCHTTEMEALYAGTLRYLAPERFRGGRPTPQSDLYALGVIAFELFAAHLPGGEQVAHRPPTPEQARSLPIDPHIRESIATLLAGDPRERHVELRELVEVYAQWGGQQLPLAEVAAQESFLTSAPFVGRSRELATLRKAIEGLLKGQGGVWIIGGESGIGKSRLVEELRAEALVKRIAVVRGQANSEMNRPYQWLEETVNWLRLSVDVDHSTNAALQMVVPEHDGAAAGFALPQLDPQDAEQRLLDALETLFRRNRLPLLVIVEDIHWLTPESMTLFSKLTQRISDTPTLFIASYRCEQHPRLLQQFPHTQSLMLERLPSTDVRHLVDEMLGQRSADTFLRFVETETEGNPFFIVEVMRALATASGGPDNIDPSTPPDQIHTIGRDNVLRHRLHALPEFAQAALPLAAVIGRSIDLSLLQQLAPELNLEQWLAVCAQAYVLEAEGSGWRFAHDRLRENILRQLTAAQRRELHRQVAQALEADRGVNDRTIPLLAYHWQQAEDLTREAHYAARAGALYMRQNNYRAAASHLKRAVDLEAFVPLSERPRNENLLGEALYASGNMIEGEKHLRRALAGYRIAQTSLMNVAHQVFHQGRLRLTQAYRQLREVDTADSEHYDLIMRACEKLAQINYIRDQKLVAAYYALKGLNISEQLGVSAHAQQARFYGSMAVALGLYSQHRLAQFYLRRADAVSRGSTNYDALAWMYEATATYFAGCARWDEAERRYQECINIARQIGRKRRHLEAVGFLATLYTHQARWDSLQSLYDEFDQVDPHKDDCQARSWHLVPRSMHYLLLGKADAAFDLVTELEALLDQIDDNATRMRVLGLLTLYYMHYNLMDVAYNYATTLLDTISRTSPIAFPAIDGYVTCALFFLRRLALHPCAANEAQAQQVCSAFHTLARTFDMARPYASVCTGWYWSLRKNRSRAVQFGETARRSAQQHRLPLAEALACALLLEHLPHADARVKQIAERARTLRSATSICVELLSPAPLS